MKKYIDILFNKISFGRCGKFNHPLLLLVSSKVGVSCRKVFSIVFSVFLFFNFFVFSSNVASAAKIYFEPGFYELGIDEEFQVDLIMDSEKDSINALEGELVYPNGVLELESISDGSSIISLWVDFPEDKNGRIKFSGIVPGGFNGVLVPFEEKKIPGKILSFNFRTKEKTINDVIVLENSRVLLNDGKGTEASLTILPFLFSVLEYKKNIDQELKEGDKTPPDEFDILTVKDENVFDGQYFIVFQTSDKGSGISHYEVKEGNGQFKKAKSPYLLSDQSLANIVIVKAIDNKGNETVVILDPQEDKGYKKYSISIIILVVVFMFFILFRRFFK